jgi:hypothetical protein
MTLRWMTAFLDLPEETYDAGSGFWSTVTGYERSPQRGPDGQFATLVPPDGLDYLRLQRLTEGPRVHCDLHVDDVDVASRRAEQLGASAVARPFGDVAIMRSPGGFVFCFVPGDTGRRPAPASWPDGHTSYVDQVCLDIPPSRYGDELDFWAAVTGWARRDPRPGSEFGRLTPGPEQPLQLLMQRLDDEQPSVTAHLDWATSDRDAEIRQHVAAGAELQKSFAGWAVLRDPAGMTYCITGRSTGDRPE